MMDLSSPSPKMGKFFSKNKKNGGTKESGESDLTIMIPSHANLIKALVK